MSHCKPGCTLCTWDGAVTGLGQNPKMLFADVALVSKIKTRRMAGSCAISNRDSQVIISEPGEVIVRKSALDFVSKKNLRAINGLGNRSISQAGVGVARRGSARARQGQRLRGEPGPRPGAGSEGQRPLSCSRPRSRGTLKTLVRRVEKGS
jgi:hypothetical protein